MILIQKGNCKKCGSEFGPMDTIQSTNVQCSKCKKEVTVCRSCKEKGCECGGRLLDAWDKNRGRCSNMAGNQAYNNTYKKLTVQ